MLLLSDLDISIYFDILSCNLYLLYYIVDKSNLIYIYFCLSALIGLSMVRSQPVMAQYYGQTENKPIVVIDKKIGFGEPKEYFDNVSAAQKLFTEGEQIQFKLVVENKSKDSLYNLKVVDYLPEFLSLTLYPGTFDKKLNEVSTEIAELKSGESKEFMIIARISGLPTSVYSVNKFQLTNNSKVSNNLVSDTDSAKYFVSYQSVPNTGADDVLIKSIGVLAISLAAVGLRKLARGY